MANFVFPSVVTPAYRQVISTARRDLERLVHLVEKRPALKAELLAQIAAATSAISALP